MKLALASGQFINNDITFNVNKIKQLMIKAKEKDADLICFGESFVQGFNSLSWNFEEDRKIALPLDSQVIQSLKKYTIQIGIDLLVGYIELSDGKIYSSYLLIGNGEIICNHRRTSEGWKEVSKTDEHYQEGSKIQLINYKGWKIVLALCGELWEYPKKFKLGEDLLIWGVYCDYSAKEWENEEKEYAKYSGTICYNVAIINSISNDHSSCGGAWFIKKGEISEKISLNTEDILIIKCND